MEKQKYIEVDKDSFLMYIFYLIIYERHYLTSFYIRITFLPNIINNQIF